MKKEWFQYILAYVIWLFSLLLGFWFIIVSREGVITALTLYYAGDSIARNLQVGMMDKVYFLFVGFLWLILMIVSEEYFRKGIARKNLIHRVAIIIAPELLLIALSEISVVLELGLYQQSWLNWLRIIVELITSGLLFRLIIATQRKKSLTHS